MGKELKYPKTRWLVLWAIFFGWVGLGIMVVAYAPIIGTVAEHYNVEVGEVSFYTMGLYAALTAIVAIFAGFLFDRFGVKKILFIASLLVFVSSILTPIFVESIQGLIIQRVLLGMGAGPIMSCVAKLGHEWFPKKELGVYNGITGAGFALGIILSFMISGRVTEATGSWITAIMVLSIGPVIAMIFMILYMIFCKESDLPVVKEEHIEVMSGEAKKAFGKVLRTPVFYLLILAAMCYAWSLNAFNDLTPGYIAIPAPMGIGLGAVFAGTVMTVVQAGSVLGNILGGTIVSRFLKGNAKPVVVTAFVLNTVCTFSVKFAFVYNNTALFTVVLFLVGLSIGSIMPSIATFIGTYFPSSVTGKSYSLCLGIGVLVGSVGISVGSGVLLATGSYQGPIVIVSTVALIGLIGSLFMYKPKFNVE